MTPTRRDPRRSPDVRRLQLAVAVDPADPQPVSVRIGLMSADMSWRDAVWFAHRLLAAAAHFAPGAETFLDACNRDRDRAVADARARGWLG